MGEQTLGAATSVRTAELCRNAHISTGTQPPLLQVPSLPQLFSKWNTSASSPRPSSSSPPLLWPCPTRKWRSQVASEGLLLLLQHQLLHLQLLLVHLQLLPTPDSLASTPHLQHLHLQLLFQQHQLVHQQLLPTPDSLASTPLPPSVLSSSRSLEASVHSFPQSMPTPTRALRTPAQVSVSEQWERLLLATVSSARTVISPSGQALVLLLTPMDKSFPSLE